LAAAPIPPGWWTGTRAPSRTGKMVQMGPCTVTNTPLSKSGQPEQKNGNFAWGRKLTHYVRKAIGIRPSRGGTVACVQGKMAKLGKSPDELGRT